MRHVSLFPCVSLLQAKIVNPSLMATGNHHPLNVTTHNQPLNQSTHTQQREISPEREGEPTASTHDTTHSLNPQHSPQQPLQPTTKSINPHPQPTAIESTQTYKST